MFEQQRREAEFRRVGRVKQTEPRPISALGSEVVRFFKQSVEKRQKKFGKIADSWAQIIPGPLLSHCALESFANGSLTVLVDSSAHLYTLKQLLLEGLEKQLLLACKSATLRKISLRVGRWYEPGENGMQKVTFDR